MSKEKRYQKTRIAPTPSGFLHLGNAYSFAITAALAQSTGAGIFLRIDDMDRDRADAAYVRDIFDTLNFMGIRWTEGPENASDFERHFSQRHRLALYESALQQLANEGKVYACSCSRTEVMRSSANGTYSGVCRHKKIPLYEKGVSWRLDTSLDRTLPVRIVGGERLMARLPEDIHHFIVRKKDGFPSYQLTSLMDDVHFGVDLVVRGQDLWASTLAQLYLATELNLEAFLSASFYHHALLTGDGGQKLSKSSGDTSIQFLRRQGMSSEELYLVLGRMMGLPGQIKTWHDLAEKL